MKVVFLDSVHSILAERLTANGVNCIQANELPLSELPFILKDADGIVIRSQFRMDEEILKFAPQLKFIARSGAGMENIDEEYCAIREIVLFNAPEGNRNAVGEHTLGLLLSLLNKIHSGNQQVNSGHWNREQNRGVELDGKTIGIIGFGNNGSAFAKKLKGFDVSILAFDKYKSGFGTMEVQEIDNLERIFDECDVVSFHIPQTEETVYFANDEFFRAFKKPIFLLNVSRGSIVETKSLVRALQSGRVLGAGLDVLEYEKTSFESFFEKEIPSDFKFLVEAENVLITPHVAGWTNESYFQLSNVLADKIISKFF